MSTKPQVRLSDAGQLIASLPALIGFAPSIGSMVVITTQERRVGLTMRVDLPPSAQYEALVSQLADAATVSGADRAIVVVIDDDSRTDLVEMLLARLTDRGVAADEAYHLGDFTEGAHWHSLRGPDAHGLLPDPKATQAAAEVVAQGDVVHGHRADLAALLRPDPETETRWRGQAIDVLLRTELRTTAQSTKVVQAALRAALDGTRELSDNDYAELAVALCDPMVRDACLSTAWPPHSELAHTAARVWQTLARGLPAPERAAPATLAGYAAYAAGNGALASIALDEALTAKPGYRLAGLLKRALVHHAPPELLRSLTGHDEIGLLSELGI